MAERESGRSKFLWIVVAATVGIVAGAVSTYLLPRWFDPPDGLAVATSWPAMEACDPTFAAGAPGAEEPVISAGQTTDRAAIASEKGGGAWASGNLTLLVTPSGDKQVIIGTITPKVEPVGDTPGWIVRQLAQCGEISRREFELNLDTGVLTDQGVIGADAAGVPTPAPGGAFVVDPQQAAEVVVSAFACEGSYDFWLDIAYTVSGSATIAHESFGPYRVYGGEGILADESVEVYGNDEAGEPKLSFKCAPTS